MEPYGAGGDECLSLFAAAYATGRLTFPPGARVLEVGCAEADWMTPMLALRPDLQMTGVDWRACERPGAVTLRQDILAALFLPASFDVAIGISSVEHLGLGHYDQDPLDPEGDRRCMVRVARWLKPGGWAYADVPFEVGGFRVVGTSHRVYDAETLHTRLTPPGLRLEQVWYGTSGQEGLRDAPHPDRLHLMHYAACYWVKPTRSPEGSA